MPTLAPDVLAPIEALTDWLSRPETKQRMQTAVSEAIAETERHIVSDTSLRVPRQRAERAGHFRPWLETQLTPLDLWFASYKQQFAEQLQSDVLSMFPKTFAGLRNKNMIRETVETYLWPEVEPLLRGRAEELLLTYAVRGIALAWVSRNIGDNLLLGLPEAWDGIWRVPLHRLDTKARLGEVILDGDGEVLSDPEALRVKVQSGV